MSTTRRDRILALAWSLPDALLVLPSRNTETRRLSPAHWQLCGPCDGSGELHDRWGKPGTCHVCGGAGRYRTDPYADGQPVSGHGDLLPSRLLTKRVDCDRCGGQGVVPRRWLELEVEPGLAQCPSCDGSGKLQIPINVDELARQGIGLDSVAWRFRGGDWDTLDSALETMRCNGRRPLWRAFVAAYVEPPYERRHESTVALENVEAMMPSRVKVPDEVLVAYRERENRAREWQRKRSERMGRDHRNREIRSALRLGHPPAEVARMFAVSERTVRRFA